MPKMCKSHSDKSGLYARYTKHLPLHGIQLILYCAGHKRTAIVVQLDGVSSTYAQMFLLDLHTQLQKCSKVVVCIVSLCDFKC